ncbi:hypothetical protein XH79_41365 [Bradyrhizobium sp. CCBAU 45389]|nr:hypothetical protein [Bradyrhizobium sp. CCBAU 45389]
MVLGTSTRKRIELALLATTAMLAASMATSAAIAQVAQNPASAAVRTYAIPAGPLATALNRFADASQLQLVYSGVIARGRQTGGLNGAFTPQQAIAQLLTGSGLSYRFTGGNAVTIFDPANKDASAPPPSDGSLVLDTIDVTAKRSDGFTPDTPYETPGSVSHVSREQIDRVPPTSAGDVFVNTPGVISAGSHVGTSINPNIRGLQGMGRVATMIDGARQTTSSYRGYLGNRDETYVDPDLIGGIDISKGPSTGVGVGGIAGTINLRTLDAGDIVKDGQSYGVRLKGTVGTNAVTERAPSPLSSNTVNAASEGRPSFFNGGSQSGSVAVGAIKDNYEFLVAYSKHVQGNYFAGTNVPPGITFKPAANANALIGPGQEVFNTSENTESFLAKGKVKWGDGQSLELSYLSYLSHYGELDELSYTFALSSGLLPYGQFALSETRADTYTAKYKYEPSGNPYVNFRANLWLSDVASQRNGLIAGPSSMTTLGGDVGNKSVFATPLGELTWDNGMEFTREHATAEQFASAITGSEGWETNGPSGVRLLTGTFTNASLKPISWLTLSGGLRYDYYNSEGEGYLTKFPARSGGRASPNAGITISPVDGIQFYGQYKEGYRPPSLRESHWHYQGLLWNNPDLQPETSRNYEGGLNVLRNDVIRAGDKLRLKLSYFDNHYDDYIVRFQTGTTGDHKYEWYNIDSANYRGFEISGGYDAGPLFVEGAFTKYTKIEYCVTAGHCAPPISTAVTDADGALKNDYAANYIPPEWAGSATAGVRLLDQKLTLGVRTQFSSSRSGSVWPPTAQGTFTWPSYTVYDFFGSYRFSEDSILNFSVENITDQYYFGALTSIGVPSPGRTARVSYTTTLNDTSPFVVKLPDIRLGNASLGAPGSDWTGLYAGGHLGYGFADIRGVTTDAKGLSGGIPATESAYVDFRNLTKGFQGGFNYQFSNRVVIGVEGDFSRTKFTKTQNAVATEGAALKAASFLQAQTDYRLDWTASLRGRFGYAFDRMFVYAMGGAAFLKETEIRTQYRSNSASAALPAGTLTQTTFKEEASATRRGWTVGAGFEYALTNNWSLRGEYAYDHFGDETFRFPNATAGVTLPYSVTTRCTPFPACLRTGPATITTNYPGSSQTTNGRMAQNSLDLQAITIGLNYRF